MVKLASSWRCFHFAFMLILLSFTGVYALALKQIGSKVREGRWHLFILHNTPMNTCAPTGQSCLGTRVKAALVNLVVQSNIVWISACGLFLNNSLYEGSTSMPCLGVGHLLPFHHRNERESKGETPGRVPQKVRFCGPGACSTLLLSWKADHLIETVNPFLFSNQNSLRERMHVHICKCTLVYFCAWLGCGTTAKSKSSDLMLLLCWLLVLLLLAFTLPNKRSHPAGLHRAHLQGRQKHFLAFRLHTIPILSPLLPPSPQSHPCYKWFKAGCEWET